MKPRSIRQSFLGEDSDELLANLRVAVVGVSGGGSPIAQQVAHVGFGHALLIDSGIAQDKHRHRLIGISSAAIRHAWRKVKVVKRLMRRVHPEGTVEALPVAWQEVHELLRECHIVFACLDGYRARDELERYLRRYGVPMIDIGMDVNACEGGYQICGQVILSTQGGPCMRCFGFINDAVLAKEVGQYGAAGGRAQVVWPNGVLASTAVGVAMHLLLPWNRLRCPAPYLEYDGNKMEVRPSARLLYTPRECVHYPTSLTEMTQGSSEKAT
jgi:molybdopterin-synthase adenylyltransferase